MPLAHVKWFVDDPERFPLEWSRLLAPATLAGIGFAVAGGVFLHFLVRRIDEDRITSWIRRFLRPYLPLLLSLHLGIALIAYALTGRYLAPSLRLPEGTWGGVLTALELIVAALIILGLWTRLAAGLLVLSGPVGMFFYGVIPILERVEFLGIALYLAAVGRRKWSLDALRSSSDESPVMNPLAVGMLRMCAGLAIVVGALTEKLLAPGVAEAFLRRFPKFNILDGAGVSDRAFADAAGAVELALGLLLISGIGTRLVVLAAVIPFNVTLLFFGFTELIGHLPIYGIFLVLLVEGPGRIWFARRGPLPGSGKFARFIQTLSGKDRSVEKIRSATG
ncbi:MAG TPA: hypothetical protein VE915_08445 [Actinomycetota bacterium]|nr:hypothetical protein [Actinomycetota bacterium]